MKSHIWVVEVFDGNEWDRGSTWGSRNAARREVVVCRKYWPRARVVKFVRADS